MNSILAPPLLGDGHHDVVELEVREVAEELGPGLDLDGEGKGAGRGAWKTATRLALTKTPAWTVSLSLAEKLSRPH